MTKSRKRTSRASNAEAAPKVSFEETAYALEQAATALDALLPKHKNKIDRLRIRTTRTELRGYAKLLRAKCYEFP
ncbi:MAG: hypothetical protein GEU99_16510 [Luteitalea sp.]|nr:hypothetical protein [Luteitalea sp.]